MIPADIRLYTWLDVEDVLLRISYEGRWPSWLVWARAYWDSLTLGIQPGKRGEALDDLAMIYEPRFQVNAHNGDVDGAIYMESRRGANRLLPILLEETQESPPVPRLTPSLARPAVLRPPSVPVEPPPLLSDELPPVVAFHSFKGGVGRTLHSIALAQSFAEMKHRVLLVDADMEAPGISWLVQQRLPEPPISFADLLTLVHGDPEPQAEEAVQLVAERLAGALIDDIYVLPAFRTTGQFSSLEIRPEDLIRGADDPFLLTRLLAQLGKTIDADLVLVDLRAGLSELSVGLLLDPRVYRVLVTTLSGQSLAGTRQVLGILGRHALSTRPNDPLPALVINQISQDHRRSELLLSEETRLLEAAQPFLTADTDESASLPIVETPFDSELLALPPTWEEALASIRRSELADSMRPLIDWLPVQSNRSARGTDQSLRERRVSLRDTSRRLVYAERAEGKDKGFLATAPLRHLASDHRGDVPIAVVVGAKGAGKTYTFLQVVRRQSWEIFAKDAGATDVQIKALICPVLESKNLDPAVQQEVTEVRHATAKELGLSSPLDVSAIRDDIRDGFKTLRHEGEWRQRWLDVIAWGVGFRVGERDAGRALASYLVEVEKRLVIVVDGLEDLFQNFSSDPIEQIALRALLQEVPDWFAQQPSRPVGIVIFVRRDMVLASVRQNAAQLMSRYDPYALRWNREEALRLVAWASAKAGNLANLSSADLSELGEQDLAQELISLWGRKLGADHSREGRSAEWVIAVLSDLKGQIQARDLVTLLHLAAEKSINDTFWNDRVLVPVAIKESLYECSRQKIAEIEIENELLKAIFTKLRNLPAEKRLIPFAREDAELSALEIKTLEDNGVLLREGDEFFMPEIFRWGLDFRLRTGARPRVLTLARRAGQGG